MSERKADEQVGARLHPTLSLLTMNTRVRLWRAMHRRAIVSTHRVARLGVDRLPFLVLGIQLGSKLHRHRRFSLALASLGDRGWGRRTGLVDLVRRAKHRLACANAR